jgi:hypothetical protein
MSSSLSRQVKSIATEYLNASEMIKTTNFLQESGSGIEMSSSFCCRTKKEDFHS